MKDLLEPQELRSVTGRWRTKIPMPSAGTLTRNRIGAKRAMIALRGRRDVASANKNRVSGCG